MKEMTLKKIGDIVTVNGEKAIKLQKEYIPALEGLDGFSHIQVVWWFSGYDNEKARTGLTTHSPYRNGPETLGTFATRSPMRPNPIALTTCYVTHTDIDNGMLFLVFIDADDDTPVLDIKPYTPSLDRVENPSVPQWCKDWPQSCEASGEFDWSEVFNF